MRIFVRFALSIGAVSLFAGCGGSSPPIDTPATDIRTSRSDGIPRSATSSSYRVLYRFNRYPNGAFPMAGLIDVKGTLYGTTQKGGKACHVRSFGCGVIFSIATSGVEHSIYSFDTWQAGAYPQARLIDVKGTLYGTTYQGGIGVGTVYSISKAGTETVLHSFQTGSDGAYPEAPLLDVDGTFYGTTLGGGARNDGGTVYSISASGLHTVLYKFKGAPDGNNPTGGLINVNGTMYGTTPFGGSSTACDPYGCGTVYSITRSGVEKVLYRFAGGSDGSEPKGDLIDVSGTLYGTTVGGGTAVCYGHPTRGCGTVFSITTSGQEKVLYSFTGGSDGEAPQAGLINVNGTLYGTTSEGGGGCGYGCGTVFSVTTAGAETVLQRFAGGSDGDYPVAPVVEVNGTLYGTTEDGGNSKHGVGTVFALTL
ncbi:MAG: choice-of-anchor tandem repeat GloVer-containing protein [Candidatus Cybelea sp.]